MMKIRNAFGFLFFIMIVSASAQTVKEYTSKKGETLKEIADKFGVSYTHLLRMNKGVSRRPKANTMVKIPENLFKELKKPKDLRTDEVNNLQLFTAADTIKVHKVQPKETLYSLSKLYQISISNLIKDNPFLAEEGLKIGQELKISSVVVKAPKSNTDKSFIKTHIVTPKETLYSIAKKYELTIDELKDANVEVLSNGLTIGNVLEIPRKETQISVVRNTQQHKVIQGETLYAISRKYGISVPELLSVNDTVVVDSLSIGSVLNLPMRVLKTTTISSASPIFAEKPVKYTLKSYEDLDAVLKKFSVSKDSLLMLNTNLDSIVATKGEVLIGFEKQHLLFEERKRLKDSLVNNQVVNTLLLLPFDFKKIDTLSPTTLFSSMSSLPTMVADFYMGAQMAVDSLKKQGVTINFTVVDTEKSVDFLRKKADILQSYHPNVIIGPLYTSNTNYIASVFPKIPVYYPIFSKNQKKFHANNIIRTTTDKALFQKEIELYIKENRKGEHLLIVGLEENEAALKNLKNKFIKKDNTGTALKDDVSILSLPKEYIVQEEFLDKIKLEKDNWILIAENSNVITADVFNNSRLIPKDSVLETPIKILSFEKNNYAKNKISYKDLAKYHYTYATDKVEYSEVLTTAFDVMYLRKNGAYPSELATRGFTVTYDAILRFLKGKSEDRFKASVRNSEAFYYENTTGIQNKNQAVFVNSIENKDGVLTIMRLR